MIVVFHLKAINSRSLNEISCRDTWTSLSTMDFLTCMCIAGWYPMLSQKQPWCRERDSASQKPKVKPMGCLTRQGEFGFQSTQVRTQGQGTPGRPHLPQKLLDACQLARKAFYPVYFYKLAFLALRPDKMFQMYIPSFVLNNEENTSYGQQSPGLQSF